MLNRWVAAAMLGALGILLGDEGSGAQTPPPLPAVPSPSECNVEPRTLAAVESIVAAGTPAPRTFAEREDQLPQGVPADDQTVAQITLAARSYVACLNATAWPQVLALQTEQGIRDVLDSWLDGEPVATLYVTGSASSTIGLGAKEEVALLNVRDVRLLDDGQVGAIVAWGRPVATRGPATKDGFLVTETNFHIFVEDDGRWLLDGEISGWRESPSGTAEPPATSPPP